MKHILLMIAVVMGQTVLAADKKPLTKEESAKVIEAATRKSLKNPTGELTKADYSPRQAARQARAIGKRTASR